jgi:hypothetical protein
VNPARKTTLAVILVGAAGALGWWLFAPRNPLHVQILDVSGYAEDTTAWMGFRLTVGLTNTSRDIVTIRRIHVEPDFDQFNEAYSVGTYELTPPLVVTPGNSVSYQTATTLLNATQLSWQTHAVMLRIRVEQNGSDVEYEFPAEFDHTREPGGRALRFRDD